MGLMAEWCHQQLCCLLGSAVFNRRPLLGQSLSCGQAWATAPGTRGLGHRFSRCLVQESEYCQARDRILMGGKATYRASLPPPRGSCWWRCLPRDGPLGCSLTTHSLGTKGERSGAENWTIL